MTDAVTIRPARPDDGKMLWQWRNDAEVRHASLTTDEIPLADHLDWFSRALKNPDREIMIAESHGQPIGMVRFDREGDVGNVSILLAPGYRGKGLAKATLAEAMKCSRGGWSLLRALVKPDNAASLRLFRSLGFEVLSAGETIVLERQQEATS